MEMNELILPEIRVSTPSSDKNQNICINDFWDNLDAIYETQIL